MLKQIRPAIVSFILITAITGVIYPLIVTGIAQAAFPHQANGSLIKKDGSSTSNAKEAAGSALIGQSFDDPKYFWGRLSATSPVPYTSFSTDASFSGSQGTNFGPLNTGLSDAAKARIDALHAADPAAPANVPVDLVTASASGLDPDISPAAASYQVPRVAKARKLPEGKVRDLVLQNKWGRQLGVLGEPRVNVLELNLALDQLNSK